MLYQETTPTTVPRDVLYKIALYLAANSMQQTFLICTQLSVRMSTAKCSINPLASGHEKLLDAEEDYECDIAPSSYRLHRNWRSQHVIMR